MKLKNLISICVVLLLLTIGMVSCVKDTDYELPNLEEFKNNIPAFDGNIITFAQLTASATTEVVEHTANDAIEGYVVSSDEGGNFYKKIYIQNADKTSGVSVSINKSGLYTEFPIGAKVQIRLKGLTTQINNGGVEIGYDVYTSASGRKSVGQMAEAVYKTHLYNLQETLKTQEELTQADSLVDVLKTNNNVNQLVTFKNVSFESTAVGKTFHVATNDAQQGTNYNLIDSNGKTVIFRTSRYANFSNENVPAGLLDITGVLTKYGSTYQFMINNTDGIKVVGSGNNSGGNTPSPTLTLKTVSEVRALYTSADVTIQDDIKIKVIVTSDKDSKNITGANAYAQDDTAGIALRFTATHSYAMGTELEISLKGLTVKKFRNLLQIEGITTEKILNSQAATVPTPKTITIAEAITGNYESQLVSIADAQFTDITKTYKGTQNISTDCTNSLAVFTRNDATFANDNVSNKKGIITGILSVYDATIQLLLRNATDVNFTTDYTDCNNSGGGGNSGGGSGTGNNIFDFEDITTVSTSYKTEGSLTKNNATLAYKARTDVGEYAINSKGVMLHTNTDNPYIKITLSNGIKTLKFKYKGAFSSGTNRTVKIYDGDESSTTELGSETFTKDASGEKSVEINKTGAVTITIKSTDRQIVIDDIEWTE
ncbi:MAG: DUF5689 domain-containing protein [Capnocytophaga sp.]|nr:DUF5689 domain-containing protein [Capnocytophaga sp.]